MGKKPKKLFDFAHTHGLSAYDASYVMLALQHNALIAALDKKIVSVANKIELEVFV